MNILLVNVPSRRGKNGFMLPLGLLYVGGIIERCGHKAKILDLYLDDIELRDFDSSNLDKINRVIDDFNPSIIGYGGIATSYGRVKKISNNIRINYPGISQIAGGALSSVYESLLEKTGVDVIFHGETEVNLPVFLDKLEQKESYYDIPGISYSLDSKIIRRPPAEQIQDLDAIPFPAYHLVETKRYFNDMNDWLDAYKILLKSNQKFDSIVKNIGKASYSLPIITSRGCTHRCLFCYRHFFGVRQHSVAYVINHIKFIKKTYNIRGFQLCDELFNSNLQWVTEFTDVLEKEGLNIFYMVGGARVDKINEKILRRLKETGCIEINYGHESGSDTILKEYRKGVTGETNKDITLLTNKVGLNCPVQIVIGSPSETKNTIYETIRLLKDIDAYQYSLNYLIPLPETPIWEYVKKNRLIVDLEKYLDLVAEYGGKPILNLTKIPDKEWANLHVLIYRKLRLHYYRKTKPKFIILFILFYVIMFKISPFIPTQLKRKVIPGWIISRISKILYK